MLKELIDLRLEKEAIINTNLETVNPGVISVVMGNIENAKKDLEDIKTQYFSAIQKALVVLAVSGTKSEEFANIAKYKYKALIIDANAFNNELAQTLIVRGGSQTYTQNTHFALLDELNKAKIKYGMLSLPTPKINATTDTIYDYPVADALKTLLTKNYGTELNSAVVLRQIGEQAWADKFAGKVLAVVAYNYSDNFGDSFMPAPLLKHVCNTKPSDKDVLAVLKQAKSLLKQQSTTETNEDQNNE
jgi:hypothetical protein